MDGYKHYIRLNEAGVIILGFSTAFSEIAVPQDTDICVLEDGPRHFHEAFPDLLNQNDRGQMRYRWSSGQIVIRTQEELDEEWSSLPSPPLAPDERIAELEVTVADLTQLLAEKGITP